MICNLTRETIEEIVRIEAMKEARLASILNATGSLSPSLLDEYLQISDRLNKYQTLLSYKPLESKVSINATQSL